MNDTGHSFQAYFKRATSPLVVLSILRERPMYGYELTTVMKERSHGKYTISLLYPILYRLVEQGYVVEQGTKIVDGRARTYYSITLSGEAYLADTLREYREISALFLTLTKENMDNEE